jgi:hypothetical protein
MTFSVIGVDEHDNDDDDDTDLYDFDRFFGTSESERSWVHESLIC